MSEVKAFEANTISAGNEQLDIVRRSAAALKEVLAEIGSDERTLDMIKLRVTGLQDRLRRVIEAASMLASHLYSDHVESLGVEGGLEELLRWITDVESAISRMKPISLVDKELQEQTTEVLLLKADLDSHRSSVQGIITSVETAAKSSADSDEKQRLEEKLKELRHHFERAREQCHLRDQDIKLVTNQLAEFNCTLKKYSDWIIPMLATLRSPGLSQLSTRAFREKVRSLYKIKAVLICFSCNEIISAW